MNKFKIKMNNSIIGYTALFLIGGWFIISQSQAVSGLFSKLLLVFGLLSAVAYFVMDFKNIKSFFKASKTQRSLQLSAKLFFIVGILVLLYIIASRHTILRVDMTSNKRYSLSKQTEVVLGKIKSKVKFLIFKVEGHMLTQYAYSIEFLLKEYKLKNRNIEVELVDMQEEPAITQKFSVRTPSSVMIIYGKKTRLITVNDYIKMQMVGRRPQQVPKYEETFTSALIKMTKTKQYNVYFTTGHMEKDVYKSDEAGSSFLRDALEQEGMAVKVTNLILSKKIPEDCDLLIIAGGKDNIPAKEIKLIEDYMNKGMPAIFMVEKESSKNYKNMLSRLGVKVNNDVVMDPERFYLGSLISIPNYEHHDITKGLIEYQRRAAVVFASSLDKSPVAAEKFNPKTKQKESSFVIDSILSTSDKAWGELDNLAGKKKVQYNPGEKQGKFNLAFAVTRNIESKNKKQIIKKKSRYVVFGDSDFVSNNLFNNFPGNKDLILNSINWVLGQTKSITIRPKTQASYPLRLTKGELNFISIFAYVLMPLFVIIPGVIIYFRRRKNG